MSKFKRPVLFLLNKKALGTSKLCFTHKDQSVRLNFELSYNERTLEFNHGYNYA